jgi:hypothetical protein
MDMTQPQVSLLYLINEHFDIEEFRTLCYDLGVDHDNLRGEGKIPKIRELLRWMERRGRLEELVDAVRRLRPHLVWDFEPQRAQELQEELSAGLQPELQSAFQEFTAQVGAYLTQFTQLHHELEEWKDLHNLLQDLQNTFAACRGYAISLMRVEGSAEAKQRQQERLIYEASVNWRPCKRILNKIKQLALAVQWISEPFDASTGDGPQWYLDLSRLSGDLDASFFDADALGLPDQLSIFGEEGVDQWLYLTDKELREVVQRINQLPRPGSFLVQKK